MAACQPDRKNDCGREAVGRCDTMREHLSRAVHDRRAKWTLLLLASAAVLACSRGHRFERSDGDVTVRLSVESYPLALGRNELTLDVIDAGGAPIAGGASVEVRYGLPPMPGMGAMRESVVPTKNGDKYTLLGDIHTRAAWTFDILVTRSGKPDRVLTFVLDAM